jgi:hypothetical protein
LFAGPDYEIESHIAADLTLIFTVMIFGPLFPVLYPVAVFHFAIKWIVERIKLFKWYKEPPNYDERIIVRS